MVKIFTRVFAAVGLFAGVHSLLASRQAKNWAARRLGANTSNGLYRTFYLAQSGITLAVLLGYLSQVPDRSIYRLRGVPAYILRLGQLSGLIFATLAARQVGFDRILGVRALLQWLAGRQRILPTPEAQGPAPAETGRELKVTGPFRLTRHPLNFSPLPIFWLTPHMTFKRLAFNLIGTLYLVLGSIHEERRLLAAYGKPYRRYLNSGVSFYLPGLRR